MRLKGWRGSLLLAVGFGFVYVGVRSAPLPQCELAHYHDDLNKQGEINYCGDEETIFFDLNRLKYPVTAQISPVGSIRKGETTDFTLELKTLSGKPVTPQDIVVSHTERIHLMAVDRSLDEYHHIHPQPIGNTGKWTFSMRPGKGGPYQFYLDFITLHGVRRTLLHTSVKVPGDAQEPRLKTAKHTTTATGVEFEFVPVNTTANTLIAGEQYRLALRAKEQEEIKLQKVMGSFAHVAAFLPQRTGFAHLHPRTPVNPQQKTHPPEMQFSFTPQNEGTYRFWAQIKYNGKEHYLPFNFKVKADT